MTEQLKQMVLELDDKDLELLQQMVRQELQERKEEDTTL